MFVLVEPALAHVGDGDRLKAQCGGRADLELRVDFSGQAFCFISIRADSRLAAFAMLVVTEVPDAAAEVDSHPADAKRLRSLARFSRLGRWHFLGSSEKLSATKRYKKRYKRDLLGVAQKRKCPSVNELH